MALREGKSPTRLLVLLSVGVVLFLGVDYGLGGSLRAQVRALFQPVVSISHTMSTSLFQGEFWQSKATLHNEIIRLSAEVEREKGVYAALAAVQEENKILRSLSRLSDVAGITVPVTSSFSSSPYGTFTMGAGRSAGIQVGDIAIAGDGFVLGSVTDVSTHSAVVRAAFSPGVSTDVMTDTVAFSVQGRGGGNARAEVPRELPLSEGDVLMAPLYASRPVGVIGRIESASSSAFSDVFVLFPYNTNTIRFVFVTPR